MVVVMVIMLLLMILVLMLMMLVSPVRRCGGRGGVVVLLRVVVVVDIIFRFDAEDSLLGCRVSVHFEVLQQIIMSVEVLLAQRKRAFKG